MAEKDEPQDWLDANDSVEPSEPETGDKAEPAESEKPEGEAPESDTPPEQAEEAPPAEGEQESEEREPEGGWTLKAVQDERRKRQEAERALDEMRRQTQQPPQQKQEQPKLPDPFEDPEAYAKAVEDRAEARARDRFFEMSKAQHARDKGADAIEEAEKAFLATATPALAYEMHNAPDPYGFVLDWHEKQRALSDIGDPRTYAERVKADATKEMAAQVADLQRQLSELRQANSLPGSLAGEPSKGAASRSPEWSGPEPLDKIIG